MGFKGIKNHQIYFSIYGPRKSNILSCTNCEETLFYFNYFNRKINPLRQRPITCE